MLRVLCLSLVLTFMNACAHTPAPVVKPDLSAAPKGKTFTDWGDYIIDAGDVVNVIVEEMPKLDGPQKVSPSGYISLPTIGMVRAKGLTEIQLRESMILKLKPHMKVPRVSTNVVQMNSYVIYFEGKISKPGTYKLDSRTTLQQGLALAGGFKGEEKDRSRIVVVRDTPEGVRKRYETSVKGLKDGLAALDNFVLERGDLIIVD